MTDSGAHLILLIKSALLDEKYALPANFEATKVFALARKHGATALAYYGALNCGVDGTCEAMREAFAVVCREVLVGERQTADAEAIMQAFNENGVDFMPLKGIYLKKYYLKPEMRRMSDADVLIKVAQYDRIRPIMLSLGFTEGNEGNMECHWYKGSTHVELHKCLVPPNHKDYYDYFGDGWRLAKSVFDGLFEHRMMAEDEMIYLLAHFAKHYRTAGIGVRHVADLWVFRRANPDMDEDYIKNELMKFKLYDFYRNILRTISALFGDGEHDEVTTFIAEVVLSSGEYGKTRTRVISSALEQKKAGKNAFYVMWNKILRSFFLPYDVMCDRHPVLKKVPVLLPLMWGVHFVSRVLTKGKMKKYAKTQLHLKDAEIDEYQKTLNFVGLDFDFSEK